MIAFSIAWFDIYWYGIMYLISFIVWYGIVYAISKKNFFSKRLPKVQEAISSDIDTLLILIILWVMIWGRLWYVFIYDRAYFQESLWQILAIWGWGMSFIGGMIGVVLAIISRWLYKKWKRNDTLSVFDIILSITPLGIIFWRIGNFLNQEIYGIIVPENARWLPSAIIQPATNRNIFYVYETIDSQTRINTNFLAAFFEWFIMLVICWTIMINSIQKNRWNPGKISSLFIVWYWFVRFFLEYLRTDSQSEFLWLFTKSQYFFIGFMILGLYLLRKRRHLSV
jgi:phosphatidylglycerol:prolipoprotein diacylglycerol transferase